MYGTDERLLTWIQSVRRAYRTCIVKSFLQLCTGQLVEKWHSMHCKLNTTPIENSVLGTVLHSSPRLFSSRAVEASSGNALPGSSYRRKSAVHICMSQ